MIQRQTAGTQRGPGHQVRGLFLLGNGLPNSGSTVRGAAVEIPQSTVQMRPIAGSRLAMRF
jgi:hypothetical protein